MPSRKPFQERQQQRLLEEISFTAADKGDESVNVDAAYVDEHIGELAKDEDLSRYIL